MFTGRPYVYMYLMTAERWFTYLDHVGVKS